MNRFLKYSLFISLNLFFSFVTIFCLLYAVTYINAFFVPESLLWKGNEPRVDFLSISVQTLIFLVETLLFIYLFYAVNKFILRYDYKLTKSKSIAFRIGAINFIIIVCMVLYGIIYTIYHS